MFEFCLLILRLCRFAMMDLPQRALAFIGCCWLGIVLWLHRDHRPRRPLTGAQVAATLIATHRLPVQLGRAEGWLSDHYDPRAKAVVLSAATCDGTSIGAAAVAAHEVGHALQARRWFVPWVFRRLLAWPAGVGLGLCFWVWFVGSVLEDRRWLLASIYCFGVYALILVLELVCEADASRRGVRELVRFGLLDANEARVARRVLRAALGTYVLAFIGSASILTALLPPLWHLPPRFHYVNPHQADPPRQVYATDQ